MKYVLAPLAGFTNAAFRRLAARRGADLTYTEMVSAAGLFHGSSPTRHLMEVLPGEGPVACQLFGAKPEELAFAAAEATKLNRFVELNLNAGCPMTKIVKEGAGAALLRNPDKVHACLRAMVEATTLPVTLKTRPGPRPDAVLLHELLDAAETAGAKGFILHARFTSQMHGGEVQLDQLAELVRCARVPVTGNGSVKDRPTAKRMAQTGVDALMIGRAALARPGIFNELKGAAAEETPEALFQEHLDALLELREQLDRKFPKDHVPSPDGFVSTALHTHLFRYFTGRPGAAALRQRLNAIRTLAEVREVLAGGAR